MERLKSPFLSKSGSLLSSGNPIDLLSGELLCVTDEGGNRQENCKNFTVLVIKRM